MDLRIGALPDDPLAAAAAFYAHWLPQAAALLDPARHPDPAMQGEDQLVLVFAPADHTHRGWRLAAVQSLARTYAPRRINAVASDEAPAITAALRYLAAAPGVTGQYWALDGTGAAELLC